jgi:hypothetical protein
MEAMLDPARMVAFEVSREWRCVAQDTTWVILETDFTFPND